MPDDPTSIEFYHREIRPLVEKAAVALNGHDLISVALPGRWACSCDEFHSVAPGNDDFNEHLAQVVVDAIDLHLILAKAPVTSLDLGKALSNLRLAVAVDKTVTEYAELVEELVAAIEAAWGQDPRPRLP